MATVVGVVSALGKGLLAKALMFQKKARLALNRWFRQAVNQAKDVMQEQSKARAALARRQGAQSGVKLRKVAGTAEKYKYEQDTHDNYSDVTPEEMFALLDMDGDNNMTRDEFNQLFQKLNIDLTDLVKDQLFAYCDSDADGSISQEEFAEAWDWMMFKLVSACEIACTYELGWCVHLCIAFRGSHIIAC